MALLEINSNPTDRELRQFAGIWLPAFALLVGLLLWFRWPLPWAAVLVWAAAAVLGVGGVLKPRWIKPVFVGWMIAAFPIGWVISHVVVAFVFYLVLTPIGLAMRLCGYDPMHRKFDREAKTYWVQREKKRDRQSYFRQF